MAKFTSADVLGVAERLKRAKDRGHPAHFLVGAGCSISAGIPGAADLIKKIHSEYKAQCARLSDDNRYSYGACMSLLSINERRDLIRPYLASAKVNWGTIALAQLIVEGFVERVLTVNFDLVLENACALLGSQPAVYDFGVAPANDPAMIVSPAIIHLHGQSYGLILLNTEDETQKHRKKLHPVLVDSLRNAPLVIIGYSGSADGISQTLLDEFEGREPLYWIGYSEELATHLQGFGKKDHFNFLGGADFDRFMIELANSLDCWPPRLFTDPIGHLLQELKPVVAYPVVASDSSVDLLQSIRLKLDELRRKDEEERRASSLQESYMKGDFERVAKLYSSTDKATGSNDDRQIAFWSFIGWGNLLLEQAKRADGEEASKLFAAAEEKYTQALAIKPDDPDTLYNLGSLFQERAMRASGEEASKLFAMAGQKYATVLAAKPAELDALINWGGLLQEQAKRASGEEASKLFAMAGEKYAAALSIDPGDPDTLYNLGSLLQDRAKRSSGEEASKLFAAAAEKYAAALAIKSDYHAALYNWGDLLIEQAKRAHGEESSKLLAMAEEKLAAATKLDPARTYNFACLMALRHDEDQCRHYLENAEKHGTLPDYDHLAVDIDLNSMRDKPWFKELLDRQKIKKSP